MTEAVLYLFVLSEHALSNWRWKTRGSTLGTIDLLWEGGAKTCTHFLLLKVPQKVAKDECLEIFAFTQLWEHLLDLDKPLLVNPQYGLSQQDSNLIHSAHTGYYHAYLLSYQPLRLKAL